MCDATRTIIIDSAKILKCWNTRLWNTAMPWSHEQERAITGITAACNYSVHHPLPSSESIICINWCVCGMFFPTTLYNVHLYTPYRVFLHWFFHVRNGEMDQWLCVEWIFKMSSYTKNDHRIHNVCFKCCHFDSMPSPSLVSFYMYQGKMFFINILLHPSCKATYLWSNPYYLRVRCIQVLTSCPTISHHICKHLSHECP